MNPQRLHIILNAIRSDSISYKELVELIHYSRSIAESYLIAHRNSVLRYVKHMGYRCPTLLRIVSRIYSEGILKGVWFL